MPSYVRGREKGRLLRDEEIVEAYVSGETADSIAMRSGCTGVTVLQIVRRAGHEVRRPGAGAPRPRTLTDAQIIQKYRAGEHGPAIADQASCTAGTVYRILRTYGVPVRPSMSRNGGGRRKGRSDG